MKRRRYGHNKCGVIRPTKGVGVRKRLVELCRGVREPLVAHVTVDLVALVERVLQYSPAERLSPRQVLDSPYFEALRDGRETTLSNGRPTPIRRGYLDAESSVRSSCLVFHEF